MKTAIVYGTTTGNTEEVASLVEAGLEGVALEKHDIASLSASDLTAYDVLIIGCPTWNIGELQSDWEDVYEQLDSVSFRSETRFALFGCGDAFGYPDNFQDAIGIIYRKLAERGATGGFGFWPTAGYEYEESLAVLESRPNEFCGLAIDNDNEAELTEQRVADWCSQLREQLGI